MIYYSLSHLWVISKDQKVARIGLTAVAQRETGQVIYADLPAIGEWVEKDAVLCILESSKAALEIIAPLTGTIRSINEKLIDDPQLINLSCEKNGWLVELDVTEPQEFTHLLDEKDYLKKIAGHEKE